MVYWQEVESRCLREEDAYFRLFHSDVTWISMSLKSPTRQFVRKLQNNKGDINALHHGPLTKYVKLRVAHTQGMLGTFSRHRMQRKPLVSDPGMHHGTCVTHVPWCMSGSLTRGGGENVPGIPGACTTRPFTCVARGPLALGEKNPPVTGGCPHKGPVMREVLPCNDVVMCRGVYNHLFTIPSSFGSDNGLSHGGHQAIIWMNDGILLIEPLGINFSDVLIKINAILFNKMHLKMASAKWRLFRLGFNELTQYTHI